MKNVDKKLREIKAPSGEEHNPAMSCHDVKANHPDIVKNKKNMKIWIDPNGGHDYDKIQVSCEFRSKISWTCIYPQKYLYDRKQWVSSPLTAHRWFSDIQNEINNGNNKEDYEFAYEANRSQINALAGVSNIVRQDLSVNCYNTIAYYDSSTSDYTNAVHLRGFNEAVLTPGGRRKRKGGLKYNVDENEDECQHRKANDGKTKIEITTKKMDLLPIIDIALRDAGDADQQFGFELEPVCFGTKKR